MPLTAAELTQLANTPVYFESTAYPNICLRMDGTGVTAPGPGGGVVNCNWRTSGKEWFRLRPQPDGSFSIESVQFPNVFLRMEASAVTTTGPGGGTVNCQWNANGGMHEKFKFLRNDNGSYSIESVAFPNRFLRMDGSGVTSNTSTGAGKVNAQFNAKGGGMESFKVEMEQQSLNFANAEIQIQNNWCWCAATINVTKFYDPNTVWTQCTLANAELDQNNCCGAAGAQWPCNQGRWPDTALTRVGHLDQDLARALTAVQVGAEMADSQPVGVDMRWAGGGGHIIVIRGRYEAGGVEWLRIHDPWSGFADVRFDTFRDNYNGSGTWTRSYTTER